MLKVISANLNGIRSATRKGFGDWMPSQEADFVCVQELKAQHADMTDSMRAPEGYRGWFHTAEKKGYSGVGLYAADKYTPLECIEGVGNAEIDAEGRYIELVFDTLSIVSVYLPSGSSGEHRQDAKYRFMDFFFEHLRSLATRGRDVLLCGDWNIAHREIDLKNWRGNQKNSGFLPEERAWLSRVFDELGWVDVYRRLYPDAEGDAYTWWSNRGRARENNVGWRIDYQIATPGLAATAKSASVYKDQWFSDHAPLIVTYDWKL